MPTSRLALILALATAAAPLAAQSGDTATITIHAAQLIDGKGGLTKDALVTVRGRQIVSVARATGGRKATYELGDATLMPGIIDGHVHPGWYINKAGTLHNGRDGDTPEQSAIARVGNLYQTLMAGVTTIQSLGGREDADLRDAVERGVIPGPRIITSLGQMNNGRLTPDSLRTIVRTYKQNGADVIKLFASAGLQAGGDQTMSDEQLAAICGEAKSLGLRSVVHAISAKSVRAATLAGCTQIEHGTFVTDAELALMAEKGTIFDPQVCLVFQNYVDHRDVYSRSGYTEQTFQSFTDAVVTAKGMFKRAIATPGLMVVFGTDAVALAHGRNAEEMLCRVAAGQKPMDAITSATSLGAKALGLTNVGTLAADFDADIIAVAGDPLRDIATLRHPVFVMRGGRVYH